jgi:hypothetical protein
MSPALTLPEREAIMKGYALVFFAITAGLTASAIVANLYRLLHIGTENPAGRLLRAAVMVFAGPSVLFESAMKGRVKKKWSPTLFWLVTAGVLYWCLALGLFVIDVAKHLPV